MTANRLPFAILLTLLATACNETPKEPAVTAPRPTAAPAKTATASKAKASKASAIHWDKPAAWKQIEHPSRMRKATYEITAVDGDPEAAQMSVTQVGGSIDANIQRWEGQFSEKPKAKREERKVGGLGVTIVKLHGTFAGGGMPGAAPSKSKTDWAMLAAIVDTARAAHFFKLTGPKKTVDAAQGDFESLVNSITAKN